MSTNLWNPAQYERFREERSRPFFDLLALVQPAPGMRVIDLGCGTGELTQVLHRTLQPRETIGLDSSETMLARSSAFAGDGLRFDRGDIATFAPVAEFDLIFSNAALQWVPNHQELLPRLTRGLKEGGQLAFQIPANDDAPSHTTAEEVAGLAPFREALGGFTRRDPILRPEEYAELLDRLGYREQHVRLQVYPHHLASREEVVEWTRGTMLTEYQKRLSPALFGQFVSRYREQLMTRLEDRRPFFFTYKRILCWGKR